MRVEPQAGMTFIQIDCSDLNTDDETIKQTAEGLIEGKVVEVGEPINVDGEKTRFLDLSPGDRVLFAGGYGTPVFTDREHFRSRHYVMLYRHQIMGRVG